MTSVLANTVVVPEAEDDILGSLQQMGASITHIIPVNNVETARSTVTKIETELGRPTAAHPVYFDIEKVLFRCDGAKNSAGQWVISPLNEVEWGSATYQQSYTGSVTSGQFVKLMEFTLPVKPYPRLVTASATMWGRALGSIDLAIDINGVVKLARMDSGGASDDQSYSLTCLHRVDAGTQVVVRAGVRGGSGSAGSGGSVTVSHSGTLNTLLAQALPLTIN